MAKHFLLFLLIIPVLKCFPEIKPTLDSCVILFGLTNNENIAYSGRNVIFSNDNGETFSAITDSAGKASFLLPKNSDFHIAVLSGALEAATYELTTPGMNGLVKMNYDVKMDIFDEDREGEIFITDTYSNTDSLAPSDSMALICTTLVDKEKRPIADAPVLFRNEKTKEVYVGVTGENGKFDILLPKGQEFGTRLVDKGTRLPFNIISTKTDNEFLTLTLSLEYSYSEEINYYETILKKERKTSAIEIEEPDLIVLSNVLFDFDKAILKPASFLELNHIAKILKSRKYKMLEIMGHTDNFGDDEYNLALSDRRAKAVLNCFIELGLDPKRMRSEGMGEKYPVAPNDTDENRHQNRRTEIHIVK